jgi:mannosyltransferase
MVRTSGAVGQASAIKPSDDAGQKPLLPHRLQRIAHHISSSWVLCLFVAVVALGFDLYRLGTPSIWFDEAFSVELARQPLPLLWHIIWGPEPNMELYYLFLHFWSGLTGFLGLHSTEFVVRLPSAIFAALSSVMVFLLGRRFLGITAAIVGSGLYILNNVQLTYAQQTRAYSLQLLLICIAWYALFAVLSQESHQKRWWVCYIVATALAIYVHLFSFIILLAQLIAFGALLILPGLWRATARRRLTPFIVSLVITGALSIPMLLVSLHGPKTGWLPSPYLRDIYNLFLTISANSKIYLLAVFGCLALGVLVSVLVYLPRGRHLLDRFSFNVGSDDKRKSMLQQFLPLAFALLCWLIVPVILSYSISQGSIRLFSSRYLVTILPPLFLLAGMGVSVLRWRTVQVVLTLGLFLIALRYVPLYYKNAQVEDWNTSVHWLQQRYQARDGLVCYDSDVEQGCQVSVEYYLHAYPTAAHFTGDSPGEFSWPNFGPADPHSGPEAAVDPNALATYAARHPRIFYITGRIPDDAAAARSLAAQQWLDTHYHLLDRIVTPTVTISLYAINAT